MNRRILIGFVLVSALLLGAIPLQPALAHQAHSGSHVCAPPSTSSLRQTACRMTGLSSRQVASRCAEGTSLSQMCRDRGVAPASVVSTTLSKYRRSLAAAVKHGGMTQTRADYLYRQQRKRCERFMDASTGHHDGSKCSTDTADPSEPTTACPGH